GPVRPALRGYITEDDTGPGSSGRESHVHAAEVARPLRQRVRGKPALGIDQDQSHAGVKPGVAGGLEAERRIAGPGDRAVQPVGIPRNLELEDSIVVLTALVV